MNQQFRSIFFISVSIAFVAFLHSCKKTAPSLATLSATDITFTTATSGGIIFSDGGSPITGKGVCWSTHENPTLSDDRTFDETGSKSFACEIRCLSFATTYYIRAFAANSLGIAYGNQLSFTTSGTDPINFNTSLSYDRVTDIDGNCYKTIKIGGRTWMAENLRTSRYNDGSPVPKVIANDEWSNLGEGMPPFGIAAAFCWYNNDSSTYEHLYGKLYNFGAVKTGKLCPTGWHVPNSSEMRVIYNEQNCETYTDLGWELMEAGPNHWKYDSKCRNNMTGFTALPGGYRSRFGDFEGIGYVAKYWSSTNEGGFYLVYASRLPHPNYYYFISDICSETKETGLSVRCVKD